MKKLITITTACIAISFAMNIQAAPNEPANFTKLKKEDKKNRLEQAVDKLVADLNSSQIPLRPWEEKILEFDSLIANLADCANKVRPGSELDQEVQRTISLCLLRADWTLKLASDPENDEDIAAGYRYVEKKFRSKAEKFRVIQRSINEMHTCCVKYQGKVSKYRKYYVVMMTAQETDLAIKALGNIENDMKNMLDELRAKSAEIDAILDGNKVAVNTK